jgi:hypothetical protein
MLGNGGNELFCRRDGEVFPVFAMGHPKGINRVRVKLFS